jgi:Lrp/AsnC family leucine-responsive transcriptional regulator
MDNLDQKIIELLKGNGRMSASDIARIIRLSVPAVSERIRKLEENGIIEKYTIIVNEEKLGYYMKAFILINITNKANGKELVGEIMELENVLECHHLSGEFDYIVKVIAKDGQDFERFLMEELKKIEGIKAFRSAVIFSSKQ